MNSLYNAIYLKNEPNSIELKITFSDNNHEVFKAHFPDNSLLPGFLQIDIVAEILSLKIIEIKKAKFLQPILPLDEIIFYITIKENKLNVITKKNDKKCSEFSIVRA